MGNTFIFIYFFIVIFHMKLYKKDACDLNEVKKLFAFALEKMVRLYESKYSKMDQLKFVGDSL